MKRVLMTLACILLFTGCTKSYKGYVTNKAYLEKGAKTYQNITFDEYRKMMADENSFILFLWDKSSDEFESYSVSLKNVIKNFNIKVYGLDLKNLTKDEIEVLKNKLHVSTTGLVLIKDGNVEYNYLNGKQTEDEITDYLKNERIIKKNIQLKKYKDYVLDEDFYSKNAKTYQNITFDEYKKKIDNKETFLLFVWQEGCTHCEAFKPTFENVISNINLKVYGIDLRSLSEDEYAIFKNKTFVTGTPSLVLIEEGKYVDKFVGDKSEDELLEFLNEVEVIKEA